MEMFIPAVLIYFSISIQYFSHLFSLPINQFKASSLSPSFQLLNPLTGFPAAPLLRSSVRVRLRETAVTF